ncbi:MAG: T9SS type A sorting domain-containing protein, partial [Bacteroidales bacterium]
TITMNHSSYDLSIYGNYSGSGTFAGFNNSSVYFKGSSNITISGSPTFPILWIQKNAVTNTVTANSSITSSGLYLRKGTLDMGGSSGYDLTTTSYSPAIGLDVTSDGKLYVHDANTLVQIQGAGNHLTIYKGGTLDIDAGELKITNALFNIDGGTLDMSGGIIRQQTWEGTEGYGSQWGGTNGCNITISGGDIYFENSHFTIGATTFVNITGGTIHCANSMWTSTSANWNPSAGTVEMYGSVYDGQLYNSDDENSWLWDLNITKSAPKKVYHGGPATTAYDDIVVKNNLYIANSSTLSAKQGIAANYQGKIMVYNNWDNNNGGTYEEESGKVTFKGAQNSTIYSPAGGETFYKLVINKSNKAYTVNLTDNITATYRLTLTTGTITTGVYQVYLSSDWDDNLDDDQGGGTSSIFANSWVYGNLKRAIDNPSSAGDTYWFPVGISNRSNPTVLIVGASKLSGISDITCYFKPTPTTPNLNFPSNLTEGGQTYLGVSEEGVWVFNPAGTMAGNYNLKCYFSGFSGLEDGKFSILSRPADLNNGTNWQLIGTPSNTTVASGYAYRVNCTSFSEKGIGRTPGVLPIELLSFTSECDNQKIKLLWSTASETNNDYFTIEKSKDLQTWNIVATVNGAGNSNNYIYYSAEDNEPYSGNSYYKLKQTDYDGAFTYSEIIYSSSCDNTSFEYISVYPNPAYDHLNCDIFSEENTVIDINITNTLGQSVITKKVDIKKGANSFSINVSKLMSATYYFEIKTVNGLFKYGKQILVR